MANKDVSIEVYKSDPLLDFILGEEGTTRRLCHEITSFRSQFGMAIKNRRHALGWTIEELLIASGGGSKNMGSHSIKENNPTQTQVKTWFKYMKAMGGSVEFIIRWDKDFDITPPKVIRK